MCWGPGYSPWWFSGLFHRSTSHKSPGCLCGRGIEFYPTAQGYLGSSTYLQGRLGWGHRGVSLFRSLWNGKVGASFRIRGNFWRNKTIMGQGRQNHGFYNISPSLNGPIQRLSASIAHLYLRSFQDNIPKDSSWPGPRISSAEALSLCRG